MGAVLQIESMKYDENSWKQFHTKSLQEKIPLFSREGQIFDLIYASQLTPEFCSRLFELADRIRKIAKSKEGMDELGRVLSDKRGILFFQQPSTRTFLSFQNACHILGMKTSEIRDPSTSSEVKGESWEDTIRTFSSYVDLIILRHREEAYAERAAFHLNATKRPIPVINGGSGKDEHPTQALLDLYTIQRAFKYRNGIVGKRVGFVGDLKRGRTVRSLTQLLSLYPQVKFVFIAPEAFQMRKDILELLDARKVEYEIADDLNVQIPKVDVLYMTRIQDEYDAQGESKLVETEKFHFRREHLPVFPQTSILMHPLPRRYEIDPIIDLDPRAVYWKQERNGMWIRAALILQLFQRENFVSA